MLLFLVNLQNPTAHLSVPHRAALASARTNLHQSALRLLGPNNPTTTSNSCLINPRLRALLVRQTIPPVNRTTESLLPLSPPVFQLLQALQGLKLLKLPFLVSVIQ